MGRRSRGDVSESRTEPWLFCRTDALESESCCAKAAGQADIRISPRKRPPALIRSPLRLCGACQSDSLNMAGLGKGLFGIAAARGIHFISKRPQRSTKSP